MNSVLEPASPRPRTRLRREEQREALISAAEARIAQGGLGALKARDLAGDIGVALGALYNLVADLDELTMRVSSRTLNRLEQHLMAAEAALPTQAKATPATRLIAFALAYRGFASANTNLWRAVFEHRTADARAVPDWLVEDQIRLFRPVSATLAELKPDAGEENLFLLARTLFGAVHGVVVLGLDEKLAALPITALDGQLTSLVTAFAQGLRHTENS